ncbi:hypothetical protein Shyhy01_14060 [Streptomyces hygroscopicus subsp. hygroscopicus]|nr:hypothetical protein Shyhy01_14060 [Streptomyces hygroscopicus subsp. hygroscopicus]
MGAVAVRATVIAGSAAARHDEGMIPPYPPPAPPPSPPVVSVLDLAPVVPVVVVRDTADAVPLARALAGGGLRAVEVTLRTPAALEAIRAIADQVPQAVVGAGTVLTPGQAEACVAAGARFLVSPGWTEGLLAAMRACGVPFLPGVSTASEVVALLERGGAGDEVLPGAGGGGHRVPAVAGRAVAAGAVLSDGRHRARERGGVPGTAQRRVCGRELDGTGGCGGGRGLGADRGARAGGGGDARVSVGARCR